VVGDLKRSAILLIIFQGYELGELYDLRNYSYALYVSRRSCNLATIITTIIAASGYVTEEVQDKTHPKTA
jgi:hypothetical protein